MKLRRRPSNMLICAAAVVFLASVVVRTSAQTTTGGVGNNDDCPIDCTHGSICQEGESDYSDHPTYADGTALPFLTDGHKSRTQNGIPKHCACDEGWTGLRCHRPYVKCDENGHYCYHGGQCIDFGGQEISNDQVFCDCNAASYAGNQMYGKFCELPAASACPNDDTNFCLNGGTCLENGTCDCDADKFEGPHCEFEKDQVPDCDLECGPGTCVLGLKDVEAARYSQFWNQDGDSYMYCECPDRRFGPECAMEGEVCGEEHCFNGASCIETLSVDGVTTEYKCDCTTAHTDDTNFAGKYCQSASTTFCPTSPSNQHNGKLFCTNGGTCRAESDLHLGCDCEGTGFHGPMCQYADGEDAEECTLDCQNGGKCRVGFKDVSFAKQRGKEMEDYYDQTHDGSFQHCVCDSAHFGIQCQHELQMCADGSHFCLHGSKCVSKDDGAHECDCDDAGVDGSEAFAGKYCQYSSTDVCYIGADSKGLEDATSRNKDLAFCVNNGTCKKQIYAGEPHPGCNCEPGFTGQHCELVSSTEDTPSASPISNNNGNNRSAGSKFLLAIGIILMTVFFIGSAILFTRYKKLGVDEIRSSNNNNISPHASGEDDFDGDGEPPTFEAEEGTFANEEVRANTSIDSHDLTTVEIL